MGGLVEWEWEGRGKGAEGRGARGRENLWIDFGRVGSGIINAVGFYFFNSSPLTLKTKLRGLNLKKLVRKF